METTETWTNPYQNLITLYGRKPVLEILRDSSIDIFRLHLAESNAKSDIIKEITDLADARKIEKIYHSRQALSRISKNGRQDQGVAIDIASERYRSIDEAPDTGVDLIAVDGITNPQNLGMIIRSVAASPFAGLVLPKKSCAKIDPLVHKASAGTLFKAPIYHCSDLATGVKKLKRQGFQILGLTGGGTVSLPDVPGNDGRNRLFVLGNETSGLSEDTLERCDELINIPLESGVESINVAAAAALVCFRGIFASTT